MDGMGLECEGVLEVIACTCTIGQVIFKDIKFGGLSTICFKHIIL